MIQGLFRIVCVQGDLSFRETAGMLLFKASVRFNAGCPIEQT
jgi:hypothetical protein